MENIFLLLTIAGVLIVGYALVDRVGRFLEENRRRIREQDSIDPVRTVFKAGTSAEEIAEEIKKMQENCGDNTVIVCTAEEESDQDGE